MTISERQARRRLARLGYQLCKARVRTPEDPRHGGYMIVEPSDNLVVAGGTPEFGLDLNKIADFIHREEAAAPAKPH